MYENICFGTIYVSIHDLPTRKLINRDDYKMAAQAEDFDLWLGIQVCFPSLSGMVVDTYKVNVLFCFSLGVSLARFPKMSHKDSSKGMTS